ncbi:RNA_polymerase III RPC4 family protein [Hexamita inflata]|uniref:RNA polymerase III RPC4 family protein n=1 Tax=Hexamita inflata TaxID=28002 RepID=A0AA86TJW6_9EUKA|nr:RNA polymerase III RPC4 family protein [Hexamita inflata]
MNPFPEGEMQPKKGMMFAPKAVNRLSAQKPEEPKPVQPQVRTEGFKPKPVGQNAVKSKQPQFDMGHYQNNVEGQLGDLVVQQVKAQATLMDCYPINLPFQQHQTQLSIQSDQPVVERPQQDPAITSLTLIQMPQILPLKAHLQRELQVEGRIGKLQQFKSGKMKIVLENGIEYEVFAGQTPDFYQQIVAVDTKTQVVQNVGKVDGKVAALSFE